MPQNGQTRFKNLAANTDHFRTLYIKGLKFILIREHSPLIRKRSNSSRTSSTHSENDIQISLNRSEQATLNRSLTMNELNQMKLPVTASYVLLTDAEVDESMRAVGESDRKSIGSGVGTWQELESNRRFELDKRKDRRKHEHGSVGELHSK